MSDSSDRTQDLLRGLDGGAWHAPDHMNRLEEKLVDACGRRGRRSFVGRNRTMIVAALLVVAAGISGGAYAWYTKANQYTFEIRRHGEVLSRPRVLVHRGETASITMSEGDGAPEFTIIIHYDGSTTIVGPPDIEVDMEVVEVELRE